MWVPTFQNLMISQHTLCQTGFSDNIAENATGRAEIQGIIAVNSNSGLTI